jgi:hypothetical protein
MVDLSKFNKSENKLEPLQSFNFIKFSKLKFKVDPIQDDQINDACSRNSAFAEMLYRDKTKLFFNFLEHKTKYRENISIELKGNTRSGKSTGAIAVCKYIANLTGVPFDFPNICENEINYLEKVKSGIYLDNSGFLIDEQTETHTGAGSYAEMSVIADLQNIIAKKCYHTIWCLEKGTKVRVVVNGEIVDFKIEDLVKMSFNVQSYNFNKKKVEVEQAICQNSGIKFLRQIKLVDGRIVNATDNHKFFIRRNSKMFECKVEDIKIGDELLTE